MIEVKTLQKYKCDFCKKRGIKSAIARHEKVCFRNPDRFCENCKNTGKVEDAEYGLIDCHFCSRFNPKILEDIKKYEENIKKSDEEILGELPF
jgi:ribosomal protein L37AE/L43A